MNSNQLPGGPYQGWEQAQNVNPENIDSAYITRYMTKVYGWMSLGLAITGITAAAIASNPVAVNFFLGNKLLFFGLLILQVFLVGFLVIRIQKMSSLLATAVFIGYSALMGITFSALMLTYTASSFLTVFAITAGTFGIMTAVGYFTKQDLTSFGKIMMMGLIGVLLASVVNFFVGSPTLYWIISYAGVAVFVGLIAYDTQKIKSYALLDSEEARKKGAIMGALALYLDFVNLFIFLLRLFGGRRD